MIQAEENTEKLKIKQVHSIILLDLNTNMFTKIMNGIKFIFANLSKLAVSPSDHQQDRTIFQLEDQMEKQSPHSTGT